MVLVKSGETWRERFVRTGLEMDDKIEILSGLSGGETVALPTS